MALSTLLLGSGTAHAHAGGIQSGEFPSLVTGCNGCHNSAAAIAPVVALSSSATSLTTGQQITLTLSVTTPNGTPGAAGFNIRSSQQGTFAVGGASSANTQPIANEDTQWSEATHTTPTAGEPAVFTVLWTPLPAALGLVTFTAWGNAVNGTGDRLGDRAATTMLDVTVTAACTPTAWYPDADRDTYGSATAGATMACVAPANSVANNTDCNDASLAVHPGAAETCNGVDDNCSGTVDETFGMTAPCGVGACVRTVPSCVNGVPVACTPGTPSTETCNNLDDDCNGVVDDNLPSLMCGMGACLRTAPSCVAGAVGTCVAGPTAAETCNGVDDDCDGTIDDGLVCADASVVDAATDSASADAADSANAALDGAGDAVSDALADARAEADAARPVEASTTVDSGNPPATPDGARDSGVESSAVADSAIPLADANVDVRGPADAVATRDTGIASDAPIARSDAQPRDAAGDAAPSTEGDDTGCSCRVVSRGRAGVWPLMGLALVLALGARRRSRTNNRA